MRKLVVALIVLGAVLVAADFGLRVWSERWVGTQLQTALSLPARPSVSLGGFPFTPELLSGDVASVSVSATTVPAEGLTLERVRMSLSDVTFSSHRLLAGNLRTIHAGRGTGTASVSARAVTRALRADGVPLTVTFSGGEATVSAANAPGAVHIRVGLSGNSLVLGPTAGGIPVSATLRLPRIVPGLRYTGVRVDGGLLLLSFAVSDATIPVERG